MGIASISKIKTWFLEKTDKVDKCLAKLINIKKSEGTNEHCWNQDATPVVDPVCRMLFVKEIAFYLI